MNIGDRVIVTCETIPGTQIRCNGKLGIICHITGTYARVRFGDDESWAFGLDEFELVAENLPMLEPEFSLDEIAMGQEIIHQMD